MKIASFLYNAIWKLNKNPGNFRGFKLLTTIYPFAQLGIGQQVAGLQSEGLQSEVLQFCFVLHCLFFLSFLGLRSLAKASVANEHIIASISIFFIMFFLFF